MNTYFPFNIEIIDGNYLVSADISGEDLYPLYYNFFAELGYEGNGDCWEGHITQILEKVDAELLDSIMFDPEAGGFYAHFDSEESQLRFVKLLSPIFSNLNVLREYVLKADRERIDD